MPKPSTTASSGWIQQSFRDRWILLALVRAEYDSPQLQLVRRSVLLPTYRSELPSNSWIDREEWQDGP